MACALDKSQLKKDAIVSRSFIKDVVSHHMWQNQESGRGKEIWILIKEGKDGMVAKKAALRTGACLGL